MEEKVKRWPSVKFSFGDKEFEWTGRNYLFNLSTTNTFRGCFGFEKDSSSEVIVLGMNFFRGNDVIFDREKQKLGVIETDCNRGLNPVKFIPWLDEKYTKLQEQIMREEIENLKKEREMEELYNKQKKRGKDNNPFPINYFDDDKNNEPESKLYIVFIVASILVVGFAVYKLVKNNKSDNSENSDVGYNNSSNNQYAPQVNLDENEEGNAVHNQIEMSEVNELTEVKIDTSIKEEKESEEEEGEKSDLNNVIKFN